MLASATRAKSVSNCSIATCVVLPLARQLTRALEVAPLVLEIGHRGGVLLLELWRLDHGETWPASTLSPRSTFKRLHVAADLGVKRRD